MNIGFCNGVYYRLYKSDLERFNDHVNQSFISSGASLIEIMINSEEAIDHALSLNSDFYSDFNYRSIHAPSIYYDDNEESHRVMDKIITLSERFRIDHVVFHPDTVRSWDVITKSNNINVAIENMDERKDFGRNVNDIASVLDRYSSIGLIIDLQHCYVNDPSMNLAEELHEVFYDRVIGYHISGYHEEFLHYPLYKTQRNEIVQHLQKKDVPITIESTFDSYDESKKEIKYIVNRIDK